MWTREALQTVDNATLEGSLLVAQSIADLPVMVDTLTLHAQSLRRGNTVTFRVVRRAESLSQDSDEEGELEEDQACEGFLADANRLPTDTIEVRVGEDEAFADCLYQGDISNIERLEYQDQPIEFAVNTGDVPYAEVFALCQRLALLLRIKQVAKVDVSRGIAMLRRIVMATEDSVEMSLETARSAAQRLK
eukprot:TRINITY_DN7042_c0_g1_i4.p1 TRINITY_DN7042_c0_g1~~TRINITY_DN7042_c0_g1_i4.p1  ORF type:complete len:191 (-),score=35.62 TRINITY_DN7042_c0_g1_i4:896-1468(-)